MSSLATSPAASTNHKSSSGIYYGWFDWLRLAAALLVLLSHEGIFNWDQAGNFGVQVFFALSGWLIGGILCKTERPALKRFYFNRALRIWSPYLLALAFLLAGSLLHDHITSKWIEIVFYKLTFTYNLFGTPQLAHSVALFPLQGTGNHFWSVNAEEQFYLLAPLLLVVLPRKFGRSVILWTILAVLALIAHIYASIVFGVLAAVCAHRFGAFNNTRWCRLASLLVALAATGALIAGVDYELAVPFCALGIVLFLAIPAAQSRLGEFAGGISYPLYLNAWVAAFAVNLVSKHLHLSKIVHLAAITISALAFAAILYHFFDRRILTLRQRFYTPRRATFAMATAYGAMILGCSVGLVLLFLRR
jgi:peptidoglycan/LPS O-acetylase OafA/YrhL